ncbi:MAG: sulfur carrier protein ThiS [Gammaproteobacteria bacterium]|nr:sulfur carrier protein ThiS [Gammaproteobacteria bacterium]
MEIFVNGAPREVSAGHSAYQLLADLGLLEKRLALEINCEIVPRSAYAAQHLSPGDRVEIVHAIGGG